MQLNESINLYHANKLINAGFYRFSGIPVSADTFEDLMKIFEFNLIHAEGPRILLRLIIDNPNEIFKNDIFEIKVWDYEENVQ